MRRGFDESVILHGYVISLIGVNIAGKVIGYALLRFWNVADKVCFGAKLQWHNESDELHDEQNKQT